MIVEYVPQYIDVHVQFDELSCHMVMPRTLYVYVSANPAAETMTHNVLGDNCGTVWLAGSLMGHTQNAFNLHPFGLNGHSAISGRRFDQILT